MLLFHNDYNETCHPAVLEAMCCLQGRQMAGYGMDECCANAAVLIRKKCADESLAVHFLSGGTQTNLTVIAAALRPHQAVLCAVGGHVNVHETGAIEATGHKVIGLPSPDARLTAEQIARAAQDHWQDENHEHIPQPKLVYISHPSEYGTTYTLDELEAISRVCRENKLYLFLDGARLGYGLAAAGSDVTLADLARLTDVFYIGGTKVGAMFGEAVVIKNPAIAEDFRYLIKQRGGMLAKGWLLGAQFEALFEDDLYLRIAAHADSLADRLRSTLQELGYPMPVISATNQVFVTLPDGILEQLAKAFTFALWEKASPGQSTVRFCTSWATTPESVERLCQVLRDLSK